MQSLPTSKHSFRSKNPWYGFGSTVPGIHSEKKGQARIVAITLVFSVQSRKPHVCTLEAVEPPFLFCGAFSLVTNSYVDLVAAFSETTRIRLFFTSSEQLLKSSVSSELKCCLVESQNSGRQCFGWFLVPGTCLSSSCYLQKCCWLLHKTCFFHIVVIT